MSLSKTAFRLTAVLAVLAALASSQARTERKHAFVDPLLQKMIRASEKAARETGHADAIDPGELAYFGRLAASDTKVVPPLVHIRLKLDADARHAIERLGFKTYGRMPGFASALVPIPRLKQVVDLPGVERVQPVRIPKVELDVSRPDVTSTQLEAAYGATGRGVVVGSVDTGIDYHHADFRNPDGTTRIKYIWSQDDACVGTPPPPPFDFGCLYTEADINAALSGGPSITAPDGEGHGTHTTGVAAGNGRGTGNGYPAERYIGMAPEADIIMVKTFPEPGDTSCATCYDISAGLDFIDAMAASLGEPYAINLSLGSQYGGHDGSDIDEQTIDTLIGPGIPGKVISKSAGNDRGHAIHIGATVLAGVTNTHYFTIPSYSPLTGPWNDLVAWSLWYEGGDNLTVTILDPSSGPCGQSQLSLSATTGDGLLGSSTSSGTMVIDDSSSPAPNGARFFDMEVDDQNQTPSGGFVPCPGTWTLRVHGNTITAGGRYDAWIWFSSFGSSGLEALWNTPDPSRVLSVPATAFNVTAVGAYTSKNNWLSVDGNTYHFTNDTPMGTLTSFSSPGPTRDGRIKPDLNAPGSAIVSTLSQDVPVGPTSGNQPLVVEDGVHWALPGTSFSSPHVAGVYAQLLSLNPNLDAIQLRTLVTQSARVDGYVSFPLPNSNWGYGKLDALAAADLMIKAIPDMGAAADGQTFAWSAIPEAATYNVYRGDLTLVSPTYYGSCFQPGLASPTFVDASIPVVGGGFFYNVTGVKDGVEGLLGFRSDGTPRVNSSPCP